MLSDLWIRLRALFRRNAVEGELEDEIHFHFERQVEKYVQSGLTREAAARRARLEFGGLDQVKEECRDARGVQFLESLIEDVRYGLRVLRKSPGFTAVAILTLALGMGANTAIFSVVNAVLLRPLPYKNSSRLVWAWGNSERAHEAGVSPPDFVSYRSQNRSFERLSAYFVEGAEPDNLSIRGHGEQVQGVMVTSGFFETLGARPLVGRTFSLADEEVTNPQAIVLSYHLWQGQFGADPAIVGRSVNVLGGVTVAGVMEPDFDYPLQADLWYPTPMLNAGMQQRPARFLRPIGLLRSGVTVAQAQSDLAAIAHGLAEQYPTADRGWNLRLDPMQDAIIGSARTPLLLLLGAAALVLLIACVNMANLLLARNSSRQKEIALRTALGASPPRIICQLLTESALLGLLGGGMGVLLAVFGVSLLRSFGPSSVPRLSEVGMDGNVLLFTAALSLLTGILFGIAPSLRSAKVNLQGSLKEGGRTSAGAGHQRLRSALVLSEVTISVTLLILAGLLLNSLWRTLHVNPGFNPSAVLTTQIVLSGKSYQDHTAKVAFFREFLQKVRAFPGVNAAGGVSELPLSGQFNGTFFTAAATPPKELQDVDGADWRVITGDYFEAMGIPLLAGRQFSEQDREGAPRAMIVDRPFVRQYFPNSDPIGRHLLVYEGTSGFVRCEVVGVVGGIRHDALQIPPNPTMYFPYVQVLGARSDVNIAVRGAGNSAQLVSGVRAALAAVDPNEAVSAFKNMKQIVSDSAAGDRFKTFLLALFGVLALLLAAAGIYGVMSYAVTQRTHEIGIRLALGAQPGTVLRMVIQQGMKLVGAGVVLGVALAGGLGRLMASQLYGVGAADPSTFITAAIVLGAVAMLACYIPARRAMRVDPMVALRYE